MFPQTSRLIGLSIGCLAIVLTFARPACAQHGDWLLGTNGLQSAQQFPEGMYYSNIWSYYHASGDAFAAVNNIKCGPLGRVCLSANLSGRGSLDEFVDQNVIGWTSPFKIFGANYGLLVDIPFAIVDASGAASLEPVLNLGGASLTLQSIQRSSGVTKGSITNIYVEPVNLGWHLQHLDAIVSAGFFAPSGPYNSDALLNMGFGHWTGAFGLGTILYPDAERTWSLSIFTHYLLYGSQMGRQYTLGDEVPFEWGAGKSINLNNDIVKQVTVGAIGYAQWQVTNNQIDISPTNKITAAAIDTLEHTNSRIYAAGPGINLLTKYGLYSLRYYEEFGAHAAPSGRQLMFSVALAFGEPE